MNKKIPTIILTGGGSGGHVTPLLSLARELKRQAPGCRLVFIGYSGDKADLFDKLDHDFDKTYFINAGKFRRYRNLTFWQHLANYKVFFQNVRDFFRTLASIVSAHRILSKTKPDVLFSKGGFVSVPVGIAAKLKGIPIVTHDSDSVGGLANRIVGRWAAVRTVGMPATETGFEYVGIPLAPQIKHVDKDAQAAFKKSIDVPQHHKLLLLTGGGNGSARLNQLLTEAAPQLLAANQSLSIVHITGSQHLDEVAATYKHLPADQADRVRCFGFIDDLYKYSGAADLIVSRAGATSTAEYAVQAKACIIIPSPYLASAHQLTNAQILADAGAAVVLNQDIDGGKFVQSVQDLLEDSPKRQQLAASLHALAKTDAAAVLAKIVLSTAGQ